ncbi:MAG: clan AA aspartic protease [Candidatus Handelsmanbacteria bacterium RIFCSPLOWO2_12_FULL_64_10]|uniref:Clan AA aspartic protease n=1 Tax=Handelsmanbacteria sp. (strain RIFCSPLOWO2_12_FULL_64_10) TaxID=1817868 RepID=A0A1F6CGQ5_HANXR|nr:MAG: clan AA aspartic protease [Candidatus Handelsmanbacteria bacterium RIFCSPLOWO2_12_FULL_64_10]
MISGLVNADLEATIRLKIQGTDGHEQEIEAVIDTGFNGFLTLPPSFIIALGLPWLTQGRAMLGDGRMELFDVYTATVIWDGQPLRIMVDAADTAPLVGMSLMHGYELNLQNIDGGLVSLKRLIIP